MTLVVAALGGMFLWTVLTVHPLVAETQAQALNACAVGFNSPEELAAVRTQLPADEFTFIDLTGRLLAAETAYWNELAASTEPGRPVEDPALTHILDLCDSGLRCDLWFFSGEFAGEFFGHYGSS